MVFAASRIFGSSWFFPKFIGTIWALKLPKCLLWCWWCKSISCGTIFKLLFWSLRSAVYSATRNRTTPTTFAQLVDFLGPRVSQSTREQISDRFHSVSAKLSVLESRNQFNDEKGALLIKFRGSVRVLRSSVSPPKSAGRLQELPHFLQSPLLFITHFPVFCFLHCFCCFYF